MADNRPSQDGLSKPAEERRDFLKRAALIGLPVALATVRPRTTWAQTYQDGPNGSCALSIGTSGCAQRNKLGIFAP